MALTESSYGGDLGRSAVVGQSAGAQLAAMLLLRQCREEDLEGEELDNYMYLYLFIYIDV